MLNPYPLRRLFIVALFSLSALLVISGCRSKYQKVLRSSDANLKYEKAKEYYNKEDYYRALTLFEDLVNTYRGTDRAEEIYYYYAYSNYGLRDLTSARYHFKTFADTYPRSKFAEEARFMAAYCYYLESPVFTLDQANTYKAIEALQLFINLYPQSTRVGEANELIDKLRTKLENKSFYNAKLYYNTEDYRSAIFAFRNSIDDFPDTQHKEEMEYLIVKSSYLYAKNSIESKKEERFAETIDSYLLFLDHYPQSKYLREAESIYEEALKELEHYRKVSKVNQ